MLDSFGQFQQTQVDNNMLANIARGSIKVGGGSNAPTDLDLTDGNILVGDGTDSNEVNVVILTISKQWW